MIDLHHFPVSVWDVDQAIEWCKKLSKFNLWFIEEPTAPDDVLGHAKIRAGLKGIMGVATGEHAHNRYISAKSRVGIQG